MPFVTTKVVDGTPVEAGTVNPALVEIEGEINRIDGDIEDIVDGTTPVPLPAITESDVPNLPASKITSGELPIARGGTGQATAGAAFDALSPMTALGDLIVGGAGGAAQRLAIGTPLYYPRVNAAGTGYEFVEAAPSAGGGGLTTDTVKFAIKTDTQTSSVAAGGYVAVSGTAITHALSDASNKLLLLAHLGVYSSEADGARVMCAFLAGSTLIGIGDAAGNRTRTTAFSRLSSPSLSAGVPQALLFVYEPGTTASITYNIVLQSSSNSTQAVYLNRTASDSNDIYRGRTITSLLLMEIEDVS